MVGRHEKRICFVVSPIGKEGTPERQNADDLLELVLQPALDRFHFEVIRADKIPRPGIITSEIIQLVQNADLCIIDLTGHNPNVFYECGRRHETGKPFIQVIKKGETIPFDLSGIRTIFYDTSSPRSTNASVKEIQSFLDEFEKQGTYASGASSVVSLSSLASTLEKIERGVARLSSLGSSPLAFSKGSLTPLGVAMNPREAFLTAVANGDFQSAAGLLPRLEGLLGPVKEVMNAAQMVAAAGIESGVTVTLKLLGTLKNSLDVEDLSATVGSLVQYYTMVDREKEGIGVVKPLVEDIIKTRKPSANDEAFILNQMQKLW